MIDRSSSADLPEIDISPLGRALAQLEIAVAALAEKPTDPFIRDAVIQRFEFTYELSIRILRRYISLFTGSDEEANELTFKELIRRASEYKVLRGGVLEWSDFRQARTDTVHTYNEFRAVEVASAAKDFAQEARLLFEALRGRLER